jgi:hypothetical protein
MAGKKSFSEVYKDIVERKRRYSLNIKSFSELKCKLCGKGLLSNGVSSIQEVCLSCVSSSFA